MDKAVIAGLQGYCIGGGLQLAIACDVRIATEDAILGLPAVQEAFLPGMGTYRLPRLIGMGHARHLILSGENVDAQEAYRVGMVNKIVPKADLEAELEAWAQRYLEVPRPSLTWAKRLSNQSLDLAFEQFVPVFTEAMETVIASEEHQAARAAWLERIAERQRRERPNEQFRSSYRTAVRAWIVHRRSPAENGSSAGHRRSGIEVPAYLRSVPTGRQGGPLRSRVATHDGRRGLQSTAPAMGGIPRTVPAMRRLRSTVRTP